VTVVVDRPCAAHVAVPAAGRHRPPGANLWASLGDFFTTLSAGGLSGLLLAPSVTLGADALTTLRRITVRAGLLTRSGHGIDREQERSAPGL
jgi:hypothetical protein